MLRMNCSWERCKALLNLLSLLFYGNDNSSGVRSNLTVKNFRISTSMAYGSETVPGVIWAIVYVPTG